MGERQQLLIKEKYGTMNTFSTVTAQLAAIVKENITCIPLHLLNVASYLMTKFCFPLLS